LVLCFKVNLNEYTKDIRKNSVGNVVWNDNESVLFWRGGRGGLAAIPWA
jgi:hypothetical protein